MTRHDVVQGLQSYDHLGGFGGLRGRVTGLRREGRTGEQIAEVLNREGYRTPRVGAYNGDRVRRLFRRFGLADVPAGVAGPSDLPGSDEWWLPALAAELDVKPIVVHRWRWSGWLHARQLPGENGRWIIWADGSEVRRLQRLRAHELENRGVAATAPLMTPKARRAEKPPKKSTTTRTRSDA